MMRHWMCLIMVFTCAPAWAQDEETSMAALMQEGHSVEVPSGRDEEAAQRLEILVPPGEQGLYMGQVLGVFNGVQIHWNPHPRRGMRNAFGLAHQCVELVNRYLVLRYGHRNLSGTGHADSYWYGAAGKGFVRFANGGSADPPEPEDIVVFDYPQRGQVGHVAILTQVDPDPIEGQACVVQQNTALWYECIDLRQNDNGSWVVGPYTYTLKGRTKTYRMPALGWVRPKAKQ